MNQRLRIALAGLWLGIFSCTLSAQPGIYLPFINNANPGSIVNVPVRVVNYDSIISTQFVVRWDPTVLKFLLINGLNLPDLTIDNFNTSQALDSGIVRFAYVANDFDAGVSMPDSSTIFRLRFQVEGVIGDTTGVVVTEIFPNTIFEIGTASGDIYLLDSVDITNGFVAVGFTVDAPEPVSDIDLRAFPNPFVDNLHLTFTVNQAGPVDVLLTDAQGKTVYEKHTSFTVGQHGMEIAYATLPAYSGPLFLVLRSSGEVVVRPLVKH